MLAGQNRAICTLGVGGAVRHVLLEDGGSLFLESLNGQRNLTQFVFRMVNLCAQWAYRFVHGHIVAVLQDYGIFWRCFTWNAAPHI